MMWSGRYADRWVVLVPRAPGGLAWQQLWAAASILKKARSRTRVYIIADQSIPPAVGLRSIPWYRERVKWVADHVTTHKVSIEQAAFHYARWAQHVVSPVAVDLDTDVRWTGTNKNPGNFSLWEPVPMRGNLEIRLRLESSLSTYLRLPLARRVILIGDLYPICLPVVLGDRQIMFLRSDTRSQS